GAQVLRMHPRATDTGKVEIEAFGERRIDALVRPQLDLRIGRAHLAERALPIGVELQWAGVPPLVFLELLERHIEHHHCTSVMSIHTPSRGEKCNHLMITSPP